MPIDLKVPDSHLPKLKDAYTKIYLDFWNKHSAVLQEWSEMYPILKALGIIESAAPNKQKSEEKSSNRPSIVQSLNSQEDLFNTYDSKWTWAQKATYIIKKANRGLTSREITDYLVNTYEPNLSADSAYNSLQATLSVASKEGGKFNRYKNEKDEFVYEVAKE